MRVLNKRYWPHQYNIDKTNNLDDVMRFCYNNFKSENWRNYGYRFAFKNGKDAMFFLLKWQ